MDHLRVVVTATFLVLSFFFIGCQSGKKEMKDVSSRKDSVETLAKDFVFGDDRPFLQCHASTIVKTDRGDFVVAWFAGTEEKDDDVGIWLSKGRIGTWSKPYQIVKLKNEPHWNPVLFKAPEGKIILFFKVGKEIDLWETWFMESTDNGDTWSEAKELVPGDKGGRGPVKNKPIILSDGTWLAPASDEKNKVWNAFVDRSEDSGKTWQKTSFLTLSRDSITGEGIIQPTLWESSPGKVHMLLRSSAGVICRSDSEDNGKTWSPVQKTTLPNPNSGIDLVKTESGTLALIYNNAGGNWGERHPLCVALSNDDGKTWTTPLNIETGVEGDEYSYPSVIHSGDTIITAYTWKRQRIAVWMGVAK